MKNVKIAFEQRIKTIPIDQILPLRQVTELMRQSVKYRRIVQSMSEVGIIEPLVVSRPKMGKGYLLLDGHIRLDVLRASGTGEVHCLISDDDEAFTYNKRINRLATVQEHYMLKRALERGVSEEKLAKALGVNLALVKRRRNLLDSICPEVIEQLKDKSINPGTFDALRKMKPLRQMEVAELMVMMGNFSANYAKRLLIATQQSDLAKPERPKHIAGLTAEQISRLEAETEGLHQQFKLVEQTHGENVLQLVVASTYLGKLLRNRKVDRYLTSNYPELVPELRKIITATSLDPSAPQLTS